MIAECHVGFEKLLGHIVSFSAKKDEQMIDNAMADSMPRGEGGLQRSLKGSDSATTAQGQEALQRL